jgi:hypothetical protein
MTNEQGEKPNPYVLSLEQRTMPAGLKKKGQKVWVSGVIAVQREGINNGVRPQNLMIPQEFIPQWNRQVWSYYRKSLKPKESRAIAQFSEGRELHTEPQTGGTAPTPLRQRFGRAKKL